MLDEAETLDPFLPAYCVEERGVALYALGRFADALVSLGKLMFQTSRSRLYRAAALIALNRAEDAQRVVKEAVGGNPGLKTSNFIKRELYRDPEKALELGNRLIKAGLPR